MGAGGGGFDGAVGGDVGGCVRVTGVGGGFVEAVEVAVEVGVSFEDAGDAGGVGFADGFAVPASAFGIDGGKHLLVGFGGPFEGVGKFDLVDFVVVVNEFLGFFEGVGVVGFRGELMGMPWESISSSTRWSNVEGYFVEVYEEQCCSKRMVLTTPNRHQESGQQRS